MDCNLSGGEWSEMKKIVTEVTEVSERLERDSFDDG